MLVKMRSFQANLYELKKELVRERAQTEKMEVKTCVEHWYQTQMTAFLSYLLWYDFANDHTISLLTHLKPVMYAIFISRC